MSADLLRLAAGTLRIHVNEVDVADRDDWEDRARNWLGGPVGEFCALLSPPVALALADWLDAAAVVISDWAEVVGGEERLGDLTETDEGACAVARAILREA